MTGMKTGDITLVIMSEDMYHTYFRNYENDPDLCMEGQEYVPYTYSEEKVNQYVKKQMDLKRLSLAIMYDEEIVGEILLKNIEPHVSATLSITLQSSQYKDHGIGTKAEKLAIQYAFHELDVPTVFADTVITNTRSQHVLEKVGFKYIREDDHFKYYRIDREDSHSSY